MDEPRIDKTHYGKTRQAVCEKVALDFMERNQPAIFGHIAEMLTEERAVQGAMMRLYLAGHKDGFAMAMELVLSGAINLQEINLKSDPPVLWCR